MLSNSKKQGRDGLNVEASAEKHWRGKDKKLQTPAQSDLYAAVRQAKLREGVQVAYRHSSPPLRAKSSI